MTGAVCPVCGHTAWAVAYRGPIRDGSHGKVRDNAVVHCCIGCGIERLDETFCLSDASYKSDTYRSHIGQNHDLDRHFSSHDELALYTQETLWPVSLRNQAIADVGCGGGSLLDHLKGLPSEALAIDPDTGWSASLAQRGYRWFATAQDAASDYSGRIDVAFSIQVIEHVSNPRDFLAGIRSLLKPEGALILSTPNRNDILMELLPDDFPSFFYRSQHRWYFTAETLSRCLAEAGFAVGEIRFVHRYGMANALLWLRDRQPKGRHRLPAIDRHADTLWKAYLESSGRTDCLYVIARPT